jgi:hypothetical protein
VENVSIKLWNIQKQIRKKMKLLQNWLSFLTERLIWWSRNDLIGFSLGPPDAVLVGNSAGVNSDGNNSALSLSDWLRNCWRFRILYCGHYQWSRSTSIHKLTLDAVAWLWGVWLLSTYHSPVVSALFIISAPHITNIGIDYYWYVRHNQIRWTYLLLHYSMMLWLWPLISTCNLWKKIK